MSPIAQVLRPMVSSLIIKSIKIQYPYPTNSLLVRKFSAPPKVQLKKYTKEHEWVNISDDKKTGVIGISKHASDALGEVVYVELPEVPMSVVGGDSIGAVESVKSASDINSPITCKIVSVNKILEERPKTINDGPEDESGAGGWIAKVEIGEEGIKDLQDLMDEQEYQAFTAPESH